MADKHPTTILGRLARSGQRSYTLGYRDRDFARLKADADQLAALGLVSVVPILVCGSVFLQINEITAEPLTGCTAPATEPTPEPPQ